MDIRLQEEIRNKTSPESSPKPQTISPIPCPGSPSAAPSWSSYAPKSPAASLSNTSGDESEIRDNPPVKHQTAVSSPLHTNDESESDVEIRHRSNKRKQNTFRRLKKTTPKRSKKTERRTKRQDSDLDTNQSDSSDLPTGDESDIYLNIPHSSNKRKRKSSGLKETIPKRSKESKHRAKRYSDLDDTESEEHKTITTENAFEKAVKENRALRLPRRREENSEKIEALCIDLLERMIVAKEKDIQAYREGNPVLSKIKMIRELDRTVLKVGYLEHLLNNMFLAVIKTWLTPMPDGTIPNVAVRTSLLSILSGIRVDEDWIDRIKDSQGLGRAIHYLSIYEEHLPNKKIAQRLMSKWTRLIYQTDSNFEDLLEEFKNPEAGQSVLKDGIVFERRAAEENGKILQSYNEKLRDFQYGNEKEKVLAEVPRGSKILFSTLPEESSEYDIQQRKRREQRSKELKAKRNRMFSELRRNNKSGSQKATKPSVDGRGL